MPKFAGYPANWDLMSAYDKVQWVKATFPGVTSEVPKMASHIVSSGKELVKNNFEPVKQAVTSVPKLNGQTGSEIYAQSLIDKQKAAQHAANMSAIGAGLKGLAGMKMGAAASFGLPLAAGAVGALAIRGAKKKFDKEIETGTADTMKRGDELIKAIRKQRYNKNTK